MPPSAKRLIQVAIIADSQAEGCDAACGEDWASTEILDLAARRVRERFGPGVKLVYLDLAQASEGQLVPGLKERIREGELGLPLLVIDSEPRISGQFDIRQLLDTIDAEIEIKS